MSQLKTLGELRLEESPFRQPKPLLLLAYLAVEGSQQRKHLAELFWLRGNRMKNLGVLLVRLRQGAGEVFETDDKKAWTMLKSDVKEVLEALDKSDWRKAVELYTGAFLEGVALEDWSSELEEWVYATREYLAERVQQALLNLAEEAAKKQDFQTVAKLAERAYKLPGLVGTEPTSLKRLYLLLSAAQSTLAALVQKEAEEYGLTLKLHSEAAKATFKREETSSSPLPVRGTSFVGRDEELTELATLLSKPNVSLLTLLGSAGVGKTRLALQLAHEQQKLDSFKDGVYFVTLDALNDASLIPPTLLSHLDLTQQSKTEPIKQLTDFIAEKHILLILDNFEQITEGSSFLSQLLNKCPHLKLLVTSRESLRLEEEHLFRLEGLPYPKTLSEVAKLSEAVQLFRERAQQAQPRFEVEKTLADVIRICQLVEGLPLGIELAASWVKLMSCQDIATEIEQGLGLLTSASKNIPERHRNLKTTFEQSWKLLTAKEKEVVRELSVFVGGFRREAASEVAGATIPILASLVDKSLLKVLPNGRYDRHPLLYQFTKEKLAEHPQEEVETRAKHAAYFIALAESIKSELRGKQQKEWLILLEQEHDNLRSVLAWSLEHEGRNTKGLQLAAALNRFWYVRGHLSEGRKWFDALLTKAVPKDLAYLKALRSSAWFAYEQADYDLAQSSYETCLKLGQELDTKDIVASTFNGLGNIASERGDYVAARDFFEQSLALERTLSNDVGIEATLYNLGIVAYNQQNYPAARTFYEESLAIERKLGDDRGIALTLTSLGSLAINQGNFASARVYLEESLTIQKAIGDKRGLAETYYGLGELEEKQGDYATAKLLHTESLKIALDIGYMWSAVHVVVRLADVAIAQNECKQAAVFLGALEKLCQNTGIALEPNYNAKYEQNVNLAKAQLEDEVFSRAWAKGRLLSLEQALEFVLEHSDSSHAGKVLQ